MDLEKAVNEICDTIIAVAIANRRIVPGSIATIDTMVDEIENVKAYLNERRETREYM